MTARHFYSVHQQHDDRNLPGFVLKATTLKHAIWFYFGIAKLLKNKKKLHYESLTKIKLGS